MKLVPIYLTYNNESIQDGVGAQVLRIVAIKAISEHYRIGYVHSGISKLTVTQLDPAQTTLEIENYISYLNQVFTLESAQEEFDLRYDLYNLSRRDLVRFSLKAFFSRKRILLRVTFPFYVTNKNPKIFMKTKEFLPNIAIKETTGKLKVVIHFRVGADSKHIDPGKAEARFIAIEYFEKVVFKIVQEFQGRDIEVCLLTDAPSKSFNYSPPVEQLKEWEKTGYQVRNGMVKINALDLGESAISKLPGFRVVHGGDPIDALREMSIADFLLMSRSTLSFLGALFNQTGKIIYPPRFGSEPLPDWISGEEYSRTI